MSIKALQEYTRFSKYAKYIPEKKRRETWNEQVDRVIKMHYEKFPTLEKELKDHLEFVKSMLLQKRILGSQRALQFGGAPIKKLNARMYNCTASYIDRARFFQEAMFVLLCGCGAGFSVQKQHIDKLPKIAPVSHKDFASYTIPDSIEGWSDAIGVLMSSYFVSDQPFPEYFGKSVQFDYSLIRPAGAPISHGGKAPGPDGLKVSMEKIKKLLSKAALNGKLRPIDAYDIVMHISDSVLSGGVRRSACLCLFSPDDTEMLNAKTGTWQHENPQRGRSNNSALLIREITTKEQFTDLMKSVKEFGEPGFFWADNTDTIYNPCGEIGMVPKTKAGESGWQFCNLCEINMKKVKNAEDFYESCNAAAILGTIQAAYTKFEYLGPVTEEIVKDEALLGVSMTGMMDTPEVAFNPDVQKNGAKLVLRTNKVIADLIGINVAARATCIKPAGTSSCILGTSSGIHPHHAHRYFRHVQVNKYEPALSFFQQYNPNAVEESVWSANNTDVVIKFLCEVPVGSITKNQIDAATLLEKVKLTQQNWVEYGTRHEGNINPTLRHNVSNTINVMPEEWHDVTNYIFRNRKWFAGISLLPVSGDKDYAQAPFTAVYTPEELVKEYGDGALFASGLIVDGLRCFDDDLWKACDSILGIGIIPLEVYEKTWKQYIIKGDQCDRFRYKSAFSGIVSLTGTRFKAQQDWVRRGKQFASRYFDGDVKLMTYCLKEVRNWKVWCDLKREYKDVEWEKFTEEDDNTKIEQTVACAGGTCSLF
jgi:ribonucleoside-triphosphate reductase